MRILGRNTVGGLRYLVGTVWVGQEGERAMTALAHKRYGNFAVASPADLRAAIRKAETRSGFTYDQLAAQARAGRFETFQARLSWVAIGGLKEHLDQP